MSIETDPTRTTQGSESEYDVASGASEVQRGYFKKPQFFGDNSMTAAYEAFTSAVSSAASYASGSSYILGDLTNERTEEDPYWMLTYDELALLERRAQSMADYGDIPLQVAMDFLAILCYIDTIDDMIIIADVLQIPELADPSLIRNPMAILSLPGLERAAFMASAVEGLVNMFRKYLQTAQSMPTGSGESSSSILENLGIFASGLGGSIQLEGGTSDLAMGNFMSELILGKRIPMNVIAKNPNMVAPSYAGKAFFGESPSSLSLVDVGQVFARKIGCFPRPSSGSGSMSFGLQNMGSFGQSMTVGTLISKVMFGTSSYTEGSKKARQIESMASQVQNMTGALITETIDIRYADTAIPMMGALSAVSAGMETSPFNADTFKSGWMQANGVTHQLQNNGSAFLETMRMF